MTLKYLKSFRVDNFDFIVDLRHFDKGEINFLVKDDFENLFEIYYSEEENNFLCYQSKGEEDVVQIDDQDFVLDCIRKFSTIFSNKEIYYERENNFIEDDQNKLIIYNKDIMYFYESKNDILFKVFKYKIIDVELIYLEQSIAKINFKKAQKSLNNLIKSNYDLLEIKLIKFDIDNIKDAIQNSGDDQELCCELEIDLKKLSNEYLLKLSMARDSRNCSSLNEVYLKNMNYFRIVFNNSLSFRIGNFFGHIFLIQNIFFKSNPNLFNLVLSRIANSVLLALSGLFFELSDLLTADFYYEKRFEIGNRLESYSDELNEFYSIAQKQCQKNTLTLIVFECVELFMTYTVDISCYFVSEVYY
ncbi:MAG: hypothetical protein ACKO47_00710, partial [Alphaproteobacteria bacterium]